MDSAERPQAGQTVIIERRERVGWVRRLVGVLMMVLLALFLYGMFLTRDSGLPTALSERYVAGGLTSTKVAIVDVEGFLLGSQVDHVIRQLRQARSDDHVRAVVLRVDSPGGSVSGADRIWREVQMIRQDRKPVVASLGGMAASGGYYVAAPADVILAEPTTLTGSIGVMMELPQVEELLKKLGVEMETITTGEWKDTGSMFRRMTEEERARWKEIIQESYRRFVRIVAQGRGLSEGAVEALADGRVYTSEEAVAHKLVDQAGYLDDAILEACRRARIEPSSRVIRYARPLSLRDALLSVRGLAGDPVAAPERLIDSALLARLLAPGLYYLAR